MSELESSAPGFAQRTWRYFKLWVRRTGFTIGGLFVLYLLCALIGLIPVNHDFEETTDGVEVYVFSGQFHSDIILPLTNSTHDWSMSFPSSDFKYDTTEATHVSIGWGERNFYLHTPTWADLKVSTAAKALLVPSDTVMHVSMTTRPELDADVRRVRISIEQYQSMVSFISSSFAKDTAGKIQRIANESYGNYDAFYEGAGSYHAFRTCNCWAGEAMKVGGIRVGWFTPLPKSVFMYLGKNKPDSE